MRRRPFHRCHHNKMTPRIMNQTDFPELLLIRQPDEFRSNVCSRHNPELREDMRVI